MGIRINSFTIFRQWLVAWSSHPPAPNAPGPRDWCSLTQGGVCVFVLDQKRSLCSSCSLELCLLVLQLWQPQAEPLAGGTPSSSRGCHSTLRASTLVSVLKIPSVLENCSVVMGWCVFMQGSWDVQCSLGSLLATRRFFFCL